MSLTIVRNSATKSRSTLAARLRRLMPMLALSPSVAGVFVCVYGFIAFTVVLSFTNSKLFPSFRWVGWAQYERLFSNGRWAVAIENIAIFGGLYIVFATLLGMALAILIDRNVRFEGAFRTIYLYPLALSFIVTGVIWQWMLNPGLGLERVVRSFGWTDFEFRWLVDPKMAIYTVVIAGVWQVTGFAMALFLSGLRGINPEIVAAARVDGASAFKTYTRVILPALRPVFLTAFVIQANLALKSYDLVIALTKGGPGFSTELPSTFMYITTFTRNEMALGAASATVMLTTVAAVIVPYLYSELRHERAAD